MNKLLGVLLATALTACGGGGTPDVATPPVQLRSDLYYGYYLTSPEQVAETRGTVNLLWVGGPWGTEVAIANMKAAKLATVFDVSEQLYTQGDGKKVVNPQGEIALRELLQRLQAEGVAQYLVALYPMDEPDREVASEGDVLAANAVARKVLAEFPSLASVKLAVIYSATGRYGIASYDWVGFDHYSAGSTIFNTGGEYQQLTAQLSAEQRTLLVPGGAYGQDPLPFFNKAENDPQVVAVVPFLWTDTSGFPGIRSSSVKQSYCATGQKVLRVTVVPC